MKVIIAAGGTAGHINPGLAIADKIKTVFPESKILFVGAPEGMEARLVKKAGYDFKSYKIAGLQRSLSPENIKRNVKAAYYYLTSSRTLTKIIDEFKPDIVIGTGGFVSAPVVKTASRMGIKTATHESNSFPGMATKIMVKYADKIFLADEDTKKHLEPSDKYIITGNPLRSDIPLEDKMTALEKLRLPEGFTILSFGGSNGANKITEAVVKLIGWENEIGGINHIHSYSRNGKDLFHKLIDENKVIPNPARTRISEYIYDMYTCYSAADLVISRSGSMSQTELKAAGVPSVQIPWSGATENHQYFNALTMKNGGAAEIITDDDFSYERLLEIVKELYNDREKLKKMGENAKKMAKPNAADIIVSEIIDLLKN